MQKDNVAHFDGVLYVKNETVGYIPETIQEDENLHKGDLVILDTDFLFREKDFDEKLLDSKINTDFYRVCERRYQEERNAQEHKGCKLRNIMER